MNPAVFEETLDGFRKGVVAFLPRFAEHGFGQTFACQFPGLEPDENYGLPIASDDYSSFML